MVLTFQDEKSLQDALNLWQDYAPKVIKKGALYSIVNLPDLGEQLLINPDFEQGATGWTLGDGWSVSNGILHKISASSSNSLQNAGLIEATTYIIEIQILNVEAGNWRVSCGSGAPSAFLNDVGVIKIILTCVGAPNFFIISDIDFLGSINYVSVREILE